MASEPLDLEAMAAETLTKIHRTTEEEEGFDFILAALTKVEKTTMERWYRKGHNDGYIEGYNAAAIRARKGKDRE